ncbi:MAG: hypothetical protein ACFHWZ_03695 [Phycisphaerales bacterium]|nr:hypothetical protein [bacterium]
MSEAGNQTERVQSGTVNTQAVGLGCGSILIIALIVLVFGRADVAPLEDKIDALQTEVSQLRSEIAQLAEKVEQASQLR